MILLLFQLLILLSGVLFLVRKSHLANVSIFLVFFIALITSYWALATFSSGPVDQEILLRMIGRPLQILIDPLSAFFILVINISMVCGVLFSKHYLAHYFGEKSHTELALHYFCYLWLHIAMLLVCMFHDALAFMFAWELMTVTSFFLIIFESQKHETLRAGLKFLMQMHVGLLLIMSAFILAWVRTSGAVTSFDSLALYFAKFRAFPLFFLFFVGFGIKAGFIPFHSWLPHAHPAAPSHISGVMSGVIIKMGIYGILRVLISMHSDLLISGVFILVMSVISGLLGVMFAVVQHDVKKLLAYHSIENIGIIGMGIGSGLIGIATGHQLPAFLALSGGILHILNHSLFKSLLFFSSGSVYIHTHTRNIDRLGGIMKGMPQTSFLFLLGAAAICGLPPLNGFISEFLIYSGLFSGLRSGSLAVNIGILLSIVSLVFVGGLAIFCFTKVFGTAFLGSPRSENAKNPQEVPKGMNFPLYLIALFILWIGFFPGTILGLVEKVSAQFIPTIPNLGSTYSVFSNIGVVSIFFLVLAGTLFLIRWRQQKRVPVSYHPTWGCGYSAAKPAVHQYTATSFTETYCAIVKPVVSVETAYQAPEDHEIFPSKRSFKTHFSDFLEETLINKPVKKILYGMEKAAIFQSGKVHYYILHAFSFMAIIFILSILGVI